MHSPGWLRSVVVTLVTLLTLAGIASADDSLAERLRALDGRVIPAESETAKLLPKMIGQQVRDAIRAVNARETRAWREVKTREDWERFRDVRIKALRDSLGTFPPASDVKVRVVQELAGDGHRVRSIVFESRPGLLVTANLYLPAEAPKSAAGFLICHSHHAPKTEGELQDMGVTWARAGNVVLVMDQLGHGERRQHPFVDATSYAKPYRTGRQDYYFRFNVGQQLHVIGESQTGWMVNDMMRGVDVLLAEPGVDKGKIILLGSVAGGGDPAAVTAALDPRIAAVAPFNFGGPQPETSPLSPDAEDSFNYAGGGSWESTRNLRLSARDGFQPWVVVGAAAPRRLIYSHEFSWDRDNDPVWKRFEKIYDLYGVRDRLSAAPGKGRIGTPDNATECNNIGPWHRKLMHPLFKGWFDMPVPAEEAKVRRPSQELWCLKPEAAKDIKPRSLVEIAAELGEERAAAARKNLSGLTPEERRKRLRETWAGLLGGVDVKQEPIPTKVETTMAGGVAVHRLTLEVEPGVLVPLLLMVPPGKSGMKSPVVVGVSQQGKAELLKGRSEIIAGLLDAGVAVCLPDVRGTGESSPGGRDRQSGSTSISSSELMLGRTLLGLRIRDLRSVVKYLRSRDDLDVKRLALWGDSLAPVNAADREVKIPLELEQPSLGEPLGGLLALFGALYEDGVRAVHVRGGLASYQSVLKSPFLCLPHDAVVPGALTAGDLSDVAAALAPRPVKLEAMIDGLNKTVAADSLATTYMSAENVRTAVEPESAAKVAAWLGERLKP